MIRVPCFLILLFACQLVTVAFAQKYTFELQQPHADGVYQVGEPIQFSARMFEEGEPASGITLRGILYHNGKEVRRQDFHGGELAQCDTSMDAPGWCHWTVVGVGANNEILEYEIDGKIKRVQSSIGAIVAPLEIQAGAPEPADFDAFWEKEKRALRSVPMEVKRTPVTEGIPEHLAVEYVEVSIGSGFRPVNAIVRKPLQAEEKSLPIHIYVHGAGVHGPLNPSWAPWLPEEARAAGIQRPVLFMNLNAHGIPTNESKAFYQSLKEGELDGYQFKDSDDSEKYYMKGMILRLMRALEYLKAQPEWNGRDIVVSGGSQGGAQALIAGGIDSDVTFVYADVPAMCDFGGTLVGRASGWPKLYEKWKNGEIWLATSRDRKENKLVSLEEIEHLGYFDAANFARRIEAQSVLYTGGLDGTCPPSSVFAAYNNISHDNKTIRFDPIAGHSRRQYSDEEVQNVADFEANQKLVNSTR